MGINESKLSKGQVRKLNAQRKSVGDAPGEEAFGSSDGPVTTCLLGLGSRFETAVANVCRASNSERKAIGSELRTMPSRGTGQGLAQ